MVIEYVAIVALLRSEAETGATESEAAAAHAPHHAPVRLYTGLRDRIGLEREPACQALPSESTCAVSNGS